MRLGVVQSPPMVFIELALFWMVDFPDIRGQLLHFLPGLDGSVSVVQGTVRPHWSPGSMHRSLLRKRRSLRDFPFLDDTLSLKFLCGFRALLPVAWLWFPKWVFKVLFNSLARFLASACPGAKFTIQGILCTGLDVVGGSTLGKGGPCIGFRGFLTLLTCSNASSIKVSGYPDFKKKDFNSMSLSSRRNVSFIRREYRIPWETIIPL